MLPSAPAIPGGCASQNSLALHVLPPQAKGPASAPASIWHEHPSPSFCQVAGDPVQVHSYPAQQGSLGWQAVWLVVHAAPSVGAMQPPSPVPSSPPMHAAGVMSCQPYVLEQAHVYGSAHESK